MKKLQADYLVVGSGAVGMSFVDTLLDESDATVIIVDNHHQPGGHWNDAYPFVRLHQPSHFYGVSSTPLGSHHIDQSGSNAGYYELASGNEVQSYFEQIMRQRFLPSGRVQYFPMAEYDGDGQFHNVMSGQTYSVAVNKRVVDSTYFKTSVPSRHIRNYSVANQVDCIPPNQLPLLAAQYDHFCILGAGKTAMDAGVWLLDQGTAPDRISWVCPRQSWLMNRKVTQASVEFFEESVGGFANQMEAIASASSTDDLFDRLEACGFMLRIDTDQRPTMFHFATISVGEVDQLKRISRVIAEGHVKDIEAGTLTMNNGKKIDMQDNTLYIDCTASAVDFKVSKSRPIFEQNLITIQGLRIPNPCLSAAICAYVESHYDDDENKNRLCPPVSLPDNQQSWLATTLGNMMNQATWSGEPKLTTWISNNRLDAFSAVISDTDLTVPENKAIMEKLGSNLMPAISNLQKLIAEEAKS
ncbi:MAG: NAD(P)/FAD-dependent oxidoreductase [Oceanicoccus sp.]